MEECGSIHLFSLERFWVINSIYSWADYCLKQPCCIEKSNNRVASKSEHLMVTERKYTPIEMCDLLVSSVLASSSGTAALFVRLPRGHGNKPITSCKPIFGGPDGREIWRSNSSLPPALLVDSSSSRLERLCMRVLTCDRSTTEQQSSLWAWLPGPLLGLQASAAVRFRDFGLTFTP